MEVDQKPTVKEETDIRANKSNMEDDDDDDCDEENHSENQDSDISYGSTSRMTRWHRQVSQCRHYGSCNHLKPMSMSSIRCICEYKVDLGVIIQCDCCTVWQHVECVMPSQSERSERTYLCELCNPRPMNVAEAQDRWKKWWECREKKIEEAAKKRLATVQAKAELQKKSVSAVWIAAEWRKRIRKRIRGNENISEASNDEATQVRSNSRCDTAIPFGSQIGNMTRQLDLDEDRLGPRPSTAVPFSKPPLKQVRQNAKRKISESTEGSPTLANRPSTEVPFGRKISRKNKQKTHSTSLETSQTEQLAVMRKEARNKRKVTRQNVRSNKHSSDLANQARVENDTEVTETPPPILARYEIEPAVKEVENLEEVVALRRRVASLEDEMASYTADVVNLRRELALSVNREAELQQKLDKKNAEVDTIKAAVIAGKAKQTKAWNLISKLAIQDYFNEINMLLVKQENQEPEFDTTENLI